MKKQLGKWEWIGLVFTLIAGNLLHFVYEWSGEIPLVGAVSAVNESTWEHMKMFAVPYILFSLVEWIVLRQEKSNILSARAVGLLVGLLAIPMLVYTYKGIYGDDVMWLDILIFQVAVLLAFWVSHALLKGGHLDNGLWQLAGLVILLGIGILFILFTYRPPSLPLFIDPTTGQAGITK
ncbi:MAG: hypothetical protein GXW99_06680 [Clostridiales bacterium]|nr:hypothetical protein [Clostridiales bacterium]